MGRNFYSTFFSQNETTPPGYGWIVVYAYGNDIIDAFSHGFHRSDCQPERTNGSVSIGTYQEACELSDKLNEEAHDNTSIPTYPLTDNHQER